VTRDSINKNKCLSLFSDECLKLEYPRTVLLITIPFYSIFSFLWYKRAKLNLTEHFVLNSYKTIGELLINLLFLIITIFYKNINVLTLLYSFISIAGQIYAFWFYWQFFSVYGYSKRGLIFRSLAVIFSYMLFSVVIGIIWGILVRILQ
jgi:hypothetical protein